MSTVFVTGDGPPQVTIENLTRDYHRALDSEAGPSREASLGITQTEGAKLIINLLIDKNEINAGLDRKKKECAGYFQDFMGWLVANYFDSWDSLFEAVIHRWHTAQSG